MILFGLRAPERLEGLTEYGRVSRLVGLVEPPERLEGLTEYGRISRLVGLVELDECWISNLGRALTITARSLHKVDRVPCPLLMGSIRFNPNAACNKQLQMHASIGYSYRCPYTCTKKVYLYEVG